MLRFYFVILINLGAIFYYIPRMRYCTRHPERYSEEKRYRIARRIVRIISRTGRIKTEVHGVENLPAEGGYLMCPNHQGRFDALAVVAGHSKPCTVVMDYERSQLPIAKEVVDLLDGKRLQRDDLRQQVSVIHEITEEVKQGRRYIIFPEGGYDNNQNSLQPFHAGTFKCAMRAGCPIVPVVIVDSYKIFTKNSLRRVKNYVYFLKPIPYEEYAGLSSAQVSDLVYHRIEAQLNECA